MGSYTRIFRFTLDANQQFCVCEDRFEGQITYQEMKKVCAQPVGGQMPLPAGARTPFDYSVAKGDAEYLIWHCAIPNWHFTKPSDKACYDYVRGNTACNIGPVSVLDMDDEGNVTTIGLPNTNRVAGKGVFNLNLVCSQGDCKTTVVIDPDGENDGEDPDDSEPGPKPPANNPTPPGGG